MGGRALKNTETRRYNTDEFNKLAAKLTVLLESEFNTATSVVKSYHTKKDHGDMDILILNYPGSSIGRGEDIRTKITNVCGGNGANEIVKNGNVYSFDYDRLQIDLIIVSPEHWNTHKVFYSYDPVGNLSGKIAHKLGLKYGFEGLVYPYRSKNTNHVGDILISTNHWKIFEFIGLDFDRYLDGFETKQDIFEFIIGSKYFHPDMFRMENLTAIDRKRNKKRQTYGEFLAYINSPDLEKRFESIDFYVFDTDKKMYINSINDYFPESNILEEIKKYEAKEERYDIIRSKFNGKIIMERFTDLSGDKLGNFIRYFGSYVVNTLMKDFDNYILHASNDEINKTLDIVYTEWNNLPWNMRPCE